LESIYLPNLPCPLFAKEGKFSSPFEKGGLRGILKMQFNVAILITVLVTANL